MDDALQVLLVLLILGMGMGIGLILGIQIERRRYRAENQPEKSGAAPAVTYGTVDPTEIRTLPVDEIRESDHESDTMKCPVCGHVNPIDNMFCHDCGGRLH